MLTHSALFDLLRRNPKNRKDLDHNLNDDTHHLHGRGYFYIDFETPEEHINALKDVEKSILACAHILNCLRDLVVTMVHAKPSRRLHTESRTPIPANITFAGENTCQVDISV
jgi:hypothetical protein